MRIQTWVLSAAAVLAMAAVPARAGVIAFSLDPAGGAISGDAGQTIGWGISISNGTSNWLVVTGVTFDQTPPEISIGVFTDFLSPQFGPPLMLEVAPHSSLTQAFDRVAELGVGSYVIDGSFASPGDVAVGNIDVHFELHTVDPNGPNFPSGDIDSGGQALLAASVTYEVAQTPEPVEGGLALAGLAVLGLVKRARRRG